MASLRASVACDGVSRRTPIVLDLWPDPSSADTELEPAAGQQVEARGGAGEHGRGTQREVEHVAGDVDALRSRGDVAEERPCVEEAWLVGVVLEGDDVQSRCFGLQGQFDGSCGVRLVDVTNEPRIKSS